MADHYVLLRADQIEDALGALKGIESYAEESNVDHYIGAQKTFTSAIRKALVEDKDLGFRFYSAIEELAKRHDYTIRHEGADIDRRIAIKSAPILATVEEEHVLFDTEPVLPERPSWHFNTACHDAEGKKKEHGKETNVIGSVGCVPNGHAKTIRAISIEVLGGTVDAPLDVSFFFVCHRLSHTYKVTPGEIVPIECMDKRMFPKDQAAYHARFGWDVPSTGFIPEGGDDRQDMVIRDVEIKEIKLMALENFRVEVSGVKERAMIKLNLHGPYYSSWYGQGDSREPLPLEL